MKWLLGLFCLVFLNAQALEYAPQFENDQISVSRVKIEPHEEIGLHRDAYPQIVIASKGGTITRMEADGQSWDVHFPTGVAVFRKPDPENEMHKSMNKSSEPIELLIVQMKNIPTFAKNGSENSHDISVNIQIHCPPSDEFEDFVRSVPRNDDASDFNDWKLSFIKNMNQLIHLVESGKVSNSWWSVQTK